jgi:hypothetical protein
MIDPEKIFKVFNPDEFEGKENPYFNIYQTPTFKLGMFKKIILNQRNMTVKLDKMIEKMPEIRDLLAVDEDAGEFVTFARAWAYIKDLDPSNQTTQDSISAFYSDDYTITACKLGIHYWEEREEYEKCAHVKKILDFLKK